MRLNEIEFIGRILRVRVRGEEVRNLTPFRNRFSAIISTVTIGMHIEIRAQTHQFVFVRIDR